MSVFGIAIPGGSPVSVTAIEPFRTRVLTGTYPDGYFTNGTKYTTFSIANSAYIGGYGIITGTLTSYNVINAGTIAGTAGTILSGVHILGAGNFTNTSTGQVSGTNSGVILSGLGTVINNGTISGDRAVSASGTGTLTFTNASSGLVAGVSAGAHNGSSAVLNTTNAGQITATTYGVNLYGNGTFNNTGTVTAKVPAISYDDNAVTNAGHFVSTGQYGFWGYAGTIDFTNSGTISGSSKAAINLNHTANGTATNSASGVVTGHYGVAVKYVTFTNLGTITATSRCAYIGKNGIVINGTSASMTGISAVYANDVGTVTNYGTMHGTGVNGIYCKFGPLMIYNAGTIQGTNVGIYVNNGTLALTHAVSGTIQGNHVNVYMNSGTALIKNYGTIAGGNTAGIMWAYPAHAIGSGTVVNYAGAYIGGANGIVTQGSLSANYTITNNGSVHGTTYGGWFKGGTLSVTLTTGTTGFSGGVQAIKYGP